MAMTTPRQRLEKTAQLGLMLLLLSCAHSDPFEDGKDQHLPPRIPGPLVQLTYDLGDDMTPAWLPDGSGIAFTWTSIAPLDRNRCLAVIPAQGGTRFGEKCLRRDLLTADSISALNWVAVGPDGRAAWIDQVGKRVRLPPDRSAIRIGKLEDSDTGVAVRTFLYLAPSGNLHMTATHLTWIGANSLAYVAGQLDWPRPCSSCEADTVNTGVEVAILDLSQSPAGVRIVPNTAGANSLWASADGASIYYTINGDTRVVSQVLATGDTATLFDFASLGAGFPSDISMGGGYLAATVGSAPGSGGQIVRVNLATGTPEALVIPGQPMRGRLSPDGTSLVVQLLDLSDPDHPASMNLYLLDLAP